MRIREAERQGASLLPRMSRARGKLPVEAGAVPGFYEESAR